MRIKWQGTDTGKNVKWNVEAESYYELLQKLIEKDLIDNLETLLSRIMAWHIIKHLQKSRESIC